MRRILMVAVVVGLVGLAGAEPASAPQKRAPVAAKAKRAPAVRKAQAPVLLRAKPAAWQATPRRAAANARLLQARGMTAYKAGNYQAAVRSFSAAIDASPSPDLIYQAAQAYRLQGERAKALELYERYLEQAPDGSAAPVCRWYVERLRDTP